MSIFKSCDIRGKFGDELTGEHARRLGWALGARVGAGGVLVAGDGRLSTPELKFTLIEALVESGCRVFDLGIGPTPLFYFARRILGIEIGVMVTASHNPAADNGFKVTLGAWPVTVAEMAEIEAEMGAAHRPMGIRPGRVESVDLGEAYHHFLEGLALDLQGIRLVVDCAHGMGGLYAGRMWSATGAEVHYLFDDVDGSFPAHAPNPAESKNLGDLCAGVVKTGADLGVAYDGDADRVAFVDHLGRPLPADKAIVLFAEEALRSGPGIVVFDQKCSRVVPDAIRRMGGTPVREISGHTFIKRAFLEQNALYAGELSGHHFLRAAHGDDGLAASLVFAGMVKRSGQSLAALADGIPAYPITPDLRLPMGSDRINRLLEDLERELSGEAVLTRTDGLRIEFKDGWGLVRPSVTEPVVTMRFEAVTQAALDQILARVKQASGLLTGLL